MIEYDQHSSYRRSVSAAKFPYAKQSPYSIDVITVYAHKAKQITALCLAVNHGTAVLNFIPHFHICV